MGILMQGNRTQSRRRPAELPLIICLAGFFTLTARLTPMRDQVSEYLVVNSLVLAHEGRFPLWASGLVYYDGSPYSSQLGLHGALYSLPLRVSGEFPGSAYIWFLTGLCALLLSWAIVGICSRVGTLHGPGAKLGTLVAFVTNPSVLAFGANPYWVYAALLAPAALSLKYFGEANARPEKARNRTRFLLALGCLFALKFACGYEFASTTVMAAMLPAIAYARANALRESIKSVLAIGVVSLMAFTVVISLNVVALSVHTGTVESAAIQVAGRALTRVGYPQPPGAAGVRRAWPVRHPDYETLVRSHNESLAASTDSSWTFANRLPEGANRMFALRQLFFGSIKQSKRHALAISYNALQLGISCIILTALVLRYSNQRNRPQLAHFSRAYFFGVIASLSWFTLAFNHAYFHSVIWPLIADVSLFFPWYMLNITATVAYLVDRRRRVGTATT
jgi:hypothetical protein